MELKNNPIKEIVKDSLKKAGFRCKRCTWYRQCNDLIQAINIQKSAWGNQYYINLCFEYYDGSFLFPSEYQFSGTYSFHLSIRVEDVIANVDIGVFDYCKEYSNEYRENAIKDIFIKCLEYLNRHNSTTALKKDFKNKPNYIAVGRLRDILLA